MGTSELFNQARMERCATIATAIMENWRKTNSFYYIVRATQSVSDLSLAELRTHYFTVGIGSDLIDIPFTDLLVVFSIVEKQSAALRSRSKTSGTDFTISYEVTTDWPDDVAARLLSQIQIETPFDTGKYLRFSAVPYADSTDDPRT